MTEPEWPSFIIGRGLVPACPGSPRLGDDHRGRPALVHSQLEAAAKDLCPSMKRRHSMLHPKRFNPS